MTWPLNLAPGFGVDLYWQSRDSWLPQDKRAKSDVGPQDDIARNLKLPRQPTITGLGIPSINFQRMQL